MWEYNGGDRVFVRELSEWDRSNARKYPDTWEDFTDEDKDYLLRLLAVKAGIIKEK